MNTATAFEQMAFQSTLPARGATRCWEKEPTREETISIHAPRTGSDGAGKKSRHARKPFQSTLPARGATLSCTNWGGKAIFQSTLPARGATALVLGSSKPEAISIHAPRTGSDRQSRSREPIGFHFNPRSPHGERLGVGNHTARTLRFQSTLPARGATEQK